MHKNNRSFPNTTTVWTLIRHTGDPNDVRTRQAFAQLYELYSYPLYAQLRAWGHTHHDAEDLIHGFFVYANEHRLVDRAQPEKGRFRTFLVACLKRFRIDQYRRATAERRGGKETKISFDALAAESRYAAEPLDTLSPDKILERKLAEQVGRQALGELETEAVASGKGELFVALSGYLGADVPIEKYRILATRFNQPAGTLKAQAWEWRRRLRAIFESIVEPLVDDAAEVKSEIIALEGAMKDEPQDQPPPPGGDPRV